MVPIAAIAPLAAQTLPPPAISPAGLEQPIDGYDMQAPYQLWRYWVERQKGTVIEAALQKPATVDGLKPMGRLLSFRRYNDFGQFLGGEIASYCRVQQGSYVPEPKSCVYLLRRAYVDLAAASYGEHNPVADWTEQNFHPRALARHFRLIGIAPDTDWWGADRARLFSAAPSPHTILAENITMISLDSRECPAMASAIVATEGKAFDTPIDWPTVGTDPIVAVPRPHAHVTSLTVYLRSGGGSMTIEGGDMVERIARPILDAADACEKARKQ